MKKYVLILVSIITLSSYVIKRPLINSFFITESIPTDSLIAYYPFNGNANDESGNGYNGTVYNAYIGDSLDRFSNTNSCYYFNGSDAYITINDNDRFSMTNGSNDLAFSISFWIYQHSSVLGGIVSKTNTGQDGEWYVQVFTDNSLFFRLCDSVNAANLGKKRAYPTLNTWNHVIVTYSGNVVEDSIKIYYNNVLQSTTTGSFLPGSYSKMRNTTDPVRIGRRDGTGNYFVGKIDDVAIYKKRLTSTERSELYNN